MKNNIKVTIGLAILIVAVMGIWFWSASLKKEDSRPTEITSDYILFYGAECPHCKDLEAFIAQNGIQDKFKFDSLEVWHNKANADIFQSKLEECNIAKDQWGVPFFYGKGKCLSGTPEIEDFLKNQAGL